jgi:hypothetical protein
MELSSEAEKAKAFLEARKRYGEDYDKTIKPQLEVAQRFIGASVEYGKLAISSLILINGGGLAGLLAIHPLVRDLNQTWLIGAMWVAALFALGVFCAMAAAAVAFFNFATQATASWARLEGDDTWLKQWHFPFVDKSTTQQMSTNNNTIRQSALDQSKWAYKWALVLAIVSAACAALGGIGLAFKLFFLTLI